MAENVELNVGGVWKDIDNAEVNVGGVWKQVESIEVNVGGVWKQSWVNKVVTLSGETITAADGVAPYNTTVGIRFNSDGTIDIREDINGASSWAQIDSATDWIIPNDKSTSEAYEVRYTGKTVSQEDFTSEAAAEDVWVAISTNPEWLITDTTTNTAGEDLNCTFEIRDASAVTQGSASYSFVIENSA